MKKQSCYTVWVEPDQVAFISIEDGETISHIGLLAPFNKFFLIQILFDIQYMYDHAITEKATHLYCIEETIDNQLLPEDQRLG